MKISISNAVDESEEAKASVCSTCDKYIEEGMEGKFCRSCKMYWDDCANGLYDYDEEHKT